MLRNSGLGLVVSIWQELQAEQLQTRWNGMEIRTTSAIDFVLCGTSTKPANDSLYFDPSSLRTLEKNRQSPSDVTAGCKRRK